MTTNATIIFVYSVAPGSEFARWRTVGIRISFFFFPPWKAWISLASRRSGSNDRTRPGPYITFIPVIFHAGQTFRRMMHYLERNSGRDRPGPRRTNAREMGQEHPAECRSLFRPIDRPTNLISPRIFSDTSNACNFKNWTT